MASATYYNQPAIHKTRGTIPLAGTTHVFTVNKRVWPEKVEQFLTTLFVGTTLHVCCGKSLIGDVRLDLHEESADIRCDAADMSAHVEDQSFDTVVCDPPYNGNLQWNHNLLKELTRVTRQRIIFQHWFIPATVQGLYKKAQDTFALADVFVVQPHSYFGRAQIISVFDRRPSSLPDTRPPDRCANPGTHSRVGAAESSDGGNDFFTPGELAQAVGISTDTLRHYERLKSISKVVSRVSTHDGTTTERRLT